MRPLRGPCALMLPALLACSMLASAKEASERACAMVRRGLEAEAVRANISVAVECGDVASRTMSHDVGGDLMGPLPALRSGPAAVLVRIGPPGSGAAMVQMPLKLTVSSDAWKLLRQVAAGETIGTKDVERVRIDWPIGMQAEAASSFEPLGRARRSMRAGDLVTTALLAGYDDVARGDALNVVIRDGHLDIRTTARAVTAARTGQTLRAQLDGRQALVEGTLAADRTLLVHAR